MKGTTAPMNVSETVLQALKRNQQILVIVPGSVHAARGVLEQAEHAAGLEGLPLTTRKANGALELERPDGAGRARFMSVRQAGSYGGLRGLSLDLVLHPEQKLLPEILPTLAVRRGLAVNYFSDEAAGPALADAMG